MAIIICLLALTALTAAIFLLPLEAGLCYGRVGEDDLLELEFFLWPVFRHRVRVVVLDSNLTLGRIILKIKAQSKKGGKPGPVKKTVCRPGFRDLYSQFTFMRSTLACVMPWLKYLQKKTVIKKFIWKTGCGLGDPYLTGVTTGFIWAFKGYLLSWLYSSFRPGTLPELAVKSDFNKTGLRLKLEFRFSTRIGHLLYAGLRVITSLLVSGAAGKAYRIFRKMKRKGFPLTAGL